LRFTGTIAPKRARAAERHADQPARTGFAVVRGVAPRPEQVERLAVAEEDRWLALLHHELGSELQLAAGREPLDHLLPRGRPLQHLDRHGLGPALRRRLEDLAAFGDPAQQAIRRGQRRSGSHRGESQRRLGRLDVVEQVGSKW
jgi:hypothetical protein